MGRRNPFNIFRGTKRPQNACNECGYTWYPRGKNLSPKCPNCGSHKTAIGYGCALLVATGFLLTAAGAAVAFIR